MFKKLDITEAEGFKLGQRVQNKNNGVIGNIKYFYQNDPCYCGGWDHKTKAPKMNSGMSAVVEYLGGQSNYYLSSLIPSNKEIPALNNQGPNNLDTPKKPRLTKAQQKFKNRVQTLRKELGNEPFGSVEFAYFNYNEENESPFRVWCENLDILEVHFDLLKQSPEEIEEAIKICAGF